MTPTLPPHEWDGPAHRLAIHAAFDIWFQAHEQGARAQAHRWQNTLRQLTRQADIRRREHAAQRRLAEMEMAV
jgi:hypothetical protein